MYVYEDVLSWGPEHSSPCFPQRLWLSSQSNQKAAPLAPPCPSTSVRKESDVEVVSIHARILVAIRRFEIAAYTCSADLTKIRL